METRYGIFSSNFGSFESFSLSTCRSRAPSDIALANRVTRSLKFVGRSIAPGRVGEPPRTGSFFLAANGRFWIYRKSMFRPPRWGPTATTPCSFLRRVGGVRDGDSRSLDSDPPSQVGERDLSLSLYVGVFTASGGVGVDLVSTDCFAPLGESICSGCFGW